MNSRAYQFQLQAAEAAAAAAAAPVVHAAEDGEPEVVTPKAAPLLKIQAQGKAPDEPASSRQGSSGGLAPTTTTMGTIIGNAEAATKYCKCPECPKWFASEKAMFGHLRKHPERGYKGATRPTATAASAAAAAAVAAGDKKPTKKVPTRKETGAPPVPAMNMAAAAAATTKAWAEAELSTKWPTSAKRGRTPAELVQQASSCCSEEEEAAMILLQLASSSRTSSETQPQQQSVEPARASDAIAVSGHQIQTSSVVEEPMLLDQTPEATEQQIVVQPENALELSADQSQTAAAKQQVTDVVITTEAVLIVVPATNKPPIFPSLDSSAGAGDNKAKKQRRDTNPEQTAASLPPPEGAVVCTPPVRRIPSPASDKKRTCPTCGKSFPTHQALGGHMSSHVKGVKTTSDLAAAQAMHNIVLARRDPQSAGNGNVTITASAGAAAGALQERQDTQSPPPAPGALKERQDTRPPPAPGASQERKDTQPPPAPGTLQERQGAQPAPEQVQAQAPKAAAPHVCDECHLIFPSGQALGGHKRKHWVPEKQQAKAAAPPPAAAPAPAPGLRDFDLNEMPKEGQGGEENQSALAVITHHLHTPALKPVQPK